MSSDVATMMEIMEARISGLEEEVKLLKAKPYPKSPEHSNLGSDPSASIMIKELEIKLEREEEEQEVESRGRQKLLAEQKKSRALFERLQALKGNIRVMCRIRPPPPDTSKNELVNFGPREKGEFSEFWGHMEIPVERRNAIGNIVTSTRSFDFERIFGPEETNNDVYDDISDLVQCALHGEKVGIFAYGQTGSGKTYTLSHKDSSESAAEDGIIPRTVRSMFEFAAASTSHDYQISLSILEIYIDNIYDLQDPIDGQKVQTRIEEAKFRPLESLESAEAMIEAASRLRVSSSTSKNATSSRSHLILTFQIIKEPIKGDSENLQERGFLYLVDLAGSERSAASGLEGAQLQEGIKINKSLMSLNLVITALGKGTHAAYDTALTKALRPVLAHDSKTLMFVMVSPLKRDMVTSLQTLEKGQEATNAKLAAANRNDGKKPASTPSGRSTQPALSTGLGTQSGRITPSTPTPAGRGTSRSSHLPGRKSTGGPSSGSKRGATR
ncbi:P-loop containing nucleoside triphosphate hydrolase protein [Rostrohypoxylon terebratum]|nr:P-loop containing nucleoside triphosphate hydrolase protein [Rostrohypoxylon terebratum]